MNVDAPVARQLDEIASGAHGGQVGAFFDLDGTLVSGFTATVHAGHRIHARQASIGEMLGVLEASLRYRLGRMEFGRLVVRAAGYLQGDSLDELDELGGYLFRRHIESRVFAQMHDVVRAHQARGHTVVLSSSALTIHADPVAQYLGIERVICNQFEVDGDRRLTGGIVKPIIWGASKAAAVVRFAEEGGVDMGLSYFYADGDEDAALMRVIGHPPASQSARRSRGGGAAQRLAGAQGERWSRPPGTGRGASAARRESMMARTVRRQRPHSLPAPHASATCRDVLAPASTALATV